jgi:hypothetical protein
VLTPAGKKRGVASVVKELDGWHKKNLSKYKWLRGGIQIVDAVCPTSLFLRLFSFSFFILETDISDDRFVIDPEITNW